MRFDVSGDIESIGNKLQEKNKLQEVKKKMYECAHEFFRLLPPPNIDKNIIDSMNLEQSISHLTKDVVSIVMSRCESYSGDLDKWLSNLEWHGSYSYITSSDVSSIRWAFKFTLGRKNEVEKCIRERLENVLKKEVSGFWARDDAKSMEDRLRENHKLSDVKRKVCECANEFVRLLPPETICL